MTVPDMEREAAAGTPAGVATVEASLGAGGESPGHALESHRLRQQVALSEFGLFALQSDDLSALLQRATESCADGMAVRLCKALRYEAAEHRLFMCAGVGWKEGTVGRASVGADLASPAGYALRTGKPVISNHLGNEQRFRTPRVMVDHGVRRAINVLIMAHRKPWGVLEVDSPEEGRFEVEDIAFMQGFANLLGVAIERHDAERKLSENAEHQRLLVREASHRVKNSLAMAMSLLRLQARSGVSQETAAALGEAEARITTIAEAHDQLWRSTTAGEIDLQDFLGDLCARLQRQSPDVRLVCRAVPLVLSAERAIAAGLLVTELVTNAMKYAYPNGKGDVTVQVTTAEGTFTLVVGDRGRGLPPGFDLRTASRTGLGMRMIQSLATQLQGVLSVESTGGTAFKLVASRNGP